jgi:hypothetical protein
MPFISVDFISLKEVIMLWVTLGKLIFQKGAPLLGGVIAGMPIQLILDLICEAFGCDKIPNTTCNPCATNDLCKNITSDPCAFDKLQKIQSENSDLLGNNAVSAVMGLVRKL